MNRKGFTLVELLAVVVILAGISLTAVMGISRGAGECIVQGCEACTKEDCIYRRS